MPGTLPGHRRAGRGAAARRPGPGWRIAAIGPAGERGVKYATISHDGRHAGRGGLGAVLGAKNIKGVAVRAAGKVPAANPEALLALARDLRSRSFGPATAKYRELGTLADLLTFNAISALPTRNFQAASFEGAARLTAEPPSAAPGTAREPRAADPRARGTRVARATPRRLQATPRRVEATPRRPPALRECAGWPAAAALPARSGASTSTGQAARAGVTARAGPATGAGRAPGRAGRGKKTRGEYQNVYALGPLCGVDDPAAVLAASALCDELGVDTISPAALSPGRWSRAAGPDRRPVAALRRPRSAPAP